MHQKLLTKIHFGLLCALACFPALLMQLTNVLIALFFVSSLMCAIQNNSFFTKDGLKDLLLYTSPFLLIVIGLIIYQTDDAGFYTERSLSLLLFPLSFYFFPFKYEGQHAHILSRFFTFSTLLIVAYGLIRVTFILNDMVGAGKDFQSVEQLVNHPVYSHLLRSNFDTITKIHPSYACVYLGISALAACNNLLTKQYNKWINIFIVAICLLFEVLLAARTPFIATVFTGLVLFALHKKSFKAIFKLCGVLAVVTLILFFVSPSFSERFREVSFKNMSLPSAENENSFNIRTGIYKCSFDILNQHWLVGVGPGHAQNYLNPCYDSISKEVYGKHDYNTHNQYIDYWINLGILGPILLLAILIHVCRVNFKLQNYLVVSCILLFALAMLTENLLVRHSGVVLFGLLIGMWGYPSKKNVVF